MKLYEPIALTYILITILTMAFSGELFEVFLTKHDRDCHQANETLLREKQQGPLRDCGD